MVYANTANLPIPDDVMELMEAHQRLVGEVAALLAREEDTYSLAQPSPFKFVPSVASGNVAVESGGN